ncbi:MAG: sulfatase [bacterium]|nr:sulfatase [bacterium]
MLNDQHGLCGILPFKLEDFRLGRLGAGFCSSMTVGRLLSCLVLAGAVGCGDDSPEPTRLAYRHGALTLPGEKSPDWPRPASAKADFGRVQNVILISLDTLRRDYVSAYGDLPELPVEHRTRNLDALAARGALFLDAMAPSPSTGISHHAILHGLSAPIGKKTHFKQVIGGDVPHPIETLQAAGLRTAAFTGDGQMSPLYGWTVGFDEYTSVAFGTLGVDSLAFRELKQIERKSFVWLDAHHHEPFFLFLHSYETHCPYWPPPEQRAHYLSWYKGRTTRIECADLGQDSKVDPMLARALYAVGVAYADAFIGRLWSKLRNLGRTGDTMIVLLSDHGEQLGEDDGYIGHGRFHPTVMRIPLIIYLPGTQPSTESAPVSGIDVIPTIYAALGLKPPHEFMGKNLLPVMGTGPGELPENRLRFAHLGRNAAIYELDWQLTLWEKPESARLMNWRTGQTKFRGRQSNRIAQLRLEHESMLDHYRSLADRFRVAYTVDQTRVIDASHELEQKLRTLGYVNRTPATDDESK